VRTRFGRVLWSLGALLIALFTLSPRAGHASAAHVRWDIISVDIPITTVSPGGMAFASARIPNTLKIKLTGSGTFVAPASGGPSGAVTGCGTWETFNGGMSTGSGTYQVTGLASWQFASFQTPGLIDLIGDAEERANGNAVLRIRYSEGRDGTLGIGCHGPGAPDGIVEGVIATKGYVTYWHAEPPTYSARPGGGGLGLGAQCRRRGNSGRPLGTHVAARFRCQLRGWKLPVCDGGPLGWVSLRAVGRGPADGGPR